MLRQIKILLLVLTIVVCQGCNVSSTVINNLSYNRIKIYSLPQFAQYLTGFNCNEMKNKDGVNLKVITNPKAIEEYQHYLLDNSNYTLTNRVQKLTPRLSIEFIRKGRALKTICWSPIGLIKKGGGIYSYNKKIEKFLLNHNLIIKIIDSTANEDKQLSDSSKIKKTLNRLKK